MTSPMTLAPACGAPAAKPAYGFWATLAAAWQHTIDDWRAARDAAHAEDALRALNDHLLRDIGITRDEIPRIVRQPDVF
ncbi:hypothetical protein sos41_16940 [Alphaproteobacteria bacterium SO-S41]|nr:hypothetical protein sos41_16940 [Alphaproteobacteria bacterium SO-S41]